MGVHLSGVVGGIALIPAATAFLFRRVLPLSARVLLWHIAGTGFAVSLASSGLFAKRTTWVLGKGQDGTINALGFALFWPYHIGLRLKLALQRRISIEPTWNQVTKLLYIGAWPSEETMVPNMHVAILDITCELPLQVRPPAYKMIPVWDTHSPSAHQIELGVAWAVQQLKERPVLIHCAHGHGRSAVVTIAVLIATGLAANPGTAEAILKKARPRVRLNARQRDALVEWFVNYRKHD